MSDLYVVLRNKPIRRPGTTLMASNMYVADDSLWDEGGRRKAWKRKSRMGVPEKFRSGDVGVSRRIASCLNGNHRREQLVESRHRELHSVNKSSPTNYFVHNRSIISRVNPSH